MKRLFSIVIFGLYTLIGFAQEAPATQEATAGQEETSEDSTSQDAAAKKKTKYFVSTNSGIQKTPVGFRLGVLDRKGGYIAARFGKGDVYDENDELSTEATLFAVNAGLIFPIVMKNTFKVHTFMGIGYGQWFERPSQNGQRMGFELEGGLMFTYNKLMMNFGANMLSGDGSSPRKDITVGIGYRFNN